MNKKYKLLFILFLSLFIISPLSVWASTYYTDSIANYATSAPKGPQISNYLDGSTNYVHDYYITRDKYVPIGAVVKFYKYTPPANPIADEGSGNIEIINTVLFYNPNLTAQYNVDFYYHYSGSYTGYDYSDPNTSPSECGKSHTIKYQGVNHYKYAYEAMTVSPGSSDLTFDVDKVIATADYSFDTKNSLDSFAKNYLDYLVNTKSKMQTYFEGNFYKIDLNNLKNIYYSVEPAYAVYKGVSYSDFSTVSTTYPNSKTVTTSNHTGTTTTSYDRWCYDTCTARNSDGKCWENGKKVGTWRGRTCMDPDKWLICTQELPQPIESYECGNVTYTTTTTFNYSCKLNMHNYYNEKAPTSGKAFDAFITYTRNDSDGSGKFRELAYNIAGEKGTKHMMTSAYGSTSTAYYIGPNMREAMISYTSSSAIRIPQTFAIRLLYQGSTVSQYSSFTATVEGRVIPQTVGIKYYYFQVKIPPNECRDICADPNTSDEGLMCAINFCDSRAETYDNTNKAKRECLLNECKYNPPESNTCESLVNSPLFRDMEKDGADNKAESSYCSFTNASKTTKSYNSSDYRGSYVTCSRMGQITSPTETLTNSSGVITRTFYPYSDLQTYIDVACKETSTIDSVDISDNLIYPGAGINYTLTVKTARKCILSFDYEQWNYDYAGLSKSDDERKTLMIVKIQSWQGIGHMLDNNPSINESLGQVYRLSGKEDNPTERLRYTWDIQKVEGVLPTFQDFSVRDKKDRTSTLGYATEVINNRLSTEGMAVYGGTAAKLEKITTSTTNSYYDPDYSYYSYSVTSLPDNNEFITIRNDLDYRLLEPTDRYYAYITKSRRADPPYSQKFLLLRNHSGTHEVPKYIINEGFSESYTFPSVCVSDDGNAVVSLKKEGANCKSTVNRGMSAQAKEGYKSYFTSLSATPQYLKTIDVSPDISGVVSIKKTDVNGHVQTGAQGYYTVSDRCPYEVMGERISCSISVEYTGSKKTMGFYNLIGDNKLTFRLNIKNNLQDNDKVTDYGMYIGNSKTFNSTSEISVTESDIGNGSWYYDNIGTRTYNNILNVNGVVRTQNGKEVTCTQDVKVSKFRESQYPCNYNMGAAFNFVCADNFHGDPDAKTCVSKYDVPKIQSNEYTCSESGKAVGSDGHSGHAVVSDHGDQNGTCLVDICIERSKYSCNMINSSTCRLTDIDNNDLSRLNVSSYSYNVTAVDSAGAEYSLDKAYKCDYTNCKQDPTVEACKLPDFVDSFSPKATFESWAKKMDHKFTIRVFRVFDVLIPNGKIVKQSYAEETSIEDIVNAGGVIDVYISTDDEDYYTPENIPVLIDTFTVGNENMCNSDKVYISSITDLANKVNELGRSVKTLTVSAINGDISSFKEKVRKIFYPRDSDDFCERIETNVEYPKTYEMVCPDGTFHDRFDKCRDYGAEIAHFGTNGSTILFTGSGLDNSYSGQQFAELKYEDRANGYYLMYLPESTANGEGYLLFGNTYCKFIVNNTVDQFSCKDKYKNYAYQQSYISEYCLKYWRVDTGNYGSYDECVSQCSESLCPLDPLITQDYDKLVDWCKQNFASVGYSEYGLCVNNCYPAGDGEYKYRPININNPFPYSKSTPNAYQTGNRATGKNWIGLDESAKVYGVYRTSQYTINLNTKAIFRVKRYNQTLGLYNTNKDISNPYAEKANTNYYSSLMHSNLDSSCKSKGFCSVFVHEKFRDLFSLIPGAKNTSSWNGMEGYS